MSKNEFPWQIIDDEGVIEEGTEEEVHTTWMRMIRGDYDFSGMAPARSGDIKLVQVHGVI
ncbi:MAG: hypothetical protein M0R80_04070 [Proteobacteria bacterium]|jgi:hypothetical protein|nr:hypothetical protein [Pseudomonadota bacterium]